MPQRYVFEAYDRICTNGPCHAANAFRQDRIPLVRHRGRAFLSCFESLLRLANFRPLPVPNLQSDLLKCRSNYRKRAKIFGIPVALDNLRRNGGGFQAEFFTNAFFNIWIKERARIKTSPLQIHSDYRILFCFRRLRCCVFRFIGNGASVFQIFRFLENFISRFRARRGVLISRPLSN